MQTSGAFNLLFRPGLRKNFRDRFDRHGTEYTMFLRTGSTSVPEQAAAVMSGLSRFVERDDGEPITYEDPKMGPKVMAVDKEFAGGFMITRKAVEDDQYNKADQGSTWLAHAARMTYEYRAAEFLDDAFTGSVFKGHDGLALLHTAHTLLGTSATFANRPTTEVSFSVTGITNLLDLSQVAVDQNGDPIKIMPDTLIIGNNAGDLNRAMQIWNSELEPFTANNEPNATRMRMRMAGSKQPQVSRYKISRKSYFLIDSKYNDAELLVRRAVDFDDDFDFDTDTAKYKSTTRFVIWFVDPIGWFGANPT
jgi:hypothetical protein